MSRDTHDSGPDDRGPSLLVRTVRAGGWTVFGFGATQLLRLVGNLILTRLLFPEAFGLMAIVQAIIVGINMLSDVGLEQSVVYNKRGRDPDFLNTAWTFQVIRGLLMFVVLWLVAEPVADFYGSPQLANLVPAAGLTAIIGGLGSISLATAVRDLRVKELTIIELGTYTIGLVAMVGWAWLDQTVWALVVGSIVASTTRTIASHLYIIKGVSHRLYVEPAARTELLGFGKWIFASSALTFLVGEGNRLIVGDILDVRMLAFFSIAMSIDRLPLQVVQQIGSRVLFPAYAEVVRERPSDLQLVVAKGRLLQVLPYWAVCLFFLFFGHQIMSVLYDERYVDSGWILEALALGSLARGIQVSYDAVLWAKGMVRIGTALLTVQVAIQITAMYIGASFSGALGLVLGLSIASWIQLIVSSCVYCRLSVFQPQLDFPLFFVAIVICIIALQGMVIPTVAP